MTALIETTRAMLGVLNGSAWRDIHVRTPAGELFLAKAGGGASPMRATAVAPEAAPSVDVTAPHVATFVSARAVGTAVAAGDEIARIEVLGEESIVAAPRAGRVTAVRAAAGALLDFGQAIVAIA